MKIQIRFLPLYAVLALTLPLSAAEKHADNHKHDDKAAHGKKAGPNGGRMLTSIEPHAEFFVTSDRKVQITFLDDNGKVVAPADQMVTVTAGDRSAPTKLTFAKSGNSFVSTAVLPAGNDFPTVVQIKMTPSAKTVYERFNLNLTKCPTCAYAEYACVCDS